MKCRECQFSEEVKEKLVCKGLKAIGGDYYVLPEEDCRFPYPPDEAVSVKEAIEELGK